jgi:hypothetical protein
MTTTFSGITDGTLLSNALQSNIMEVPILTVVMMGITSLVLAYITVHDVDDTPSSSIFGTSQRGGTHNKSRVQTIKSHKRVNTRRRRRTR